MHARAASLFMHVEVLCNTEAYSPLSLQGET